MKLNTKSISRLIIFPMAFLAMLPSCKDSSFKVKGEIYGAEEKSIVLEKSDFHGQWIALDSTKVSKNGNFSISYAAPAAPEIYRLSLDGKYIYFPVDSTETVTVTSSADNFGREFTLQGSSKAEALANFEQEILALPADISPDSLKNFKKVVFSKYMREPQGSIVGYYALTKLIGKKALFSPSDPDDAKYFAAVATGFKTMRPDDPHTALLEQTSLDAMKKRNTERGTYKEIEAEEVALIDIILPDENGQEKKLSDMVGKGKPVVVVFSQLTSPEAPALNIELSRLLKNRGGLEFYNVSLDPDQYAWREAAKNLPWTTVFEPDGAYSEAARKYNVAELPVFFIYNSNGELTSRASTLEELKKKI